MPFVYHIIATRMDAHAGAFRSEKAFSGSVKVFVLHYCACMYICFTTQPMHMVAKGDGLMQPVAGKSCQNN